MLRRRMLLQSKSALASVADLHSLWRKVPAVVDVHVSATSVLPVCIKNHYSCSLSSCPYREYCCQCVRLSGRHSDHAELSFRFVFGSEFPALEKVLQPPWSVCRCEDLLLALSFPSIYSMGGRRPTVAGQGPFTQAGTVLGCGASSGRLGYVF